MFRTLLIIVAALALATPGVVSVATSMAATPQMVAGQSTPVVLLATPTITPTVTPSPGDTTPPVTTATGAGAGWRRTSATVRFSATDSQSGVAATVYKVDSGDFVVGDEVVIEAPKDHANDGEHVITFYSVDNALNAETPQTVTVKIDTKPPHFAWKSVAPGLITSIKPVDLRFTMEDISGSATLSYSVTDQYGYPAVAKGGLVRTTGARLIELVPRYKNHQGFVPGVYRVKVTATDEAGNVTVSNTRSFRNYRPMTPKLVYKVAGAGDRVALTFDDGNNSAWASILNTLKSYKAHATFFPLGPYAASSPSLMRRTVQEGNAVGTHGWTHTQMTRQSAGQIQSEWQRGTTPWWNATGYSPVPYCRPPYGDKNSAVAAASGAIGFYRIILWDVDPRDWSQPGASVIASRVLSATHAGDIVCMHLTPQTASALPAILSGLRSRGLKAATLPEMFHAAGQR